MTTMMPVTSRRNFFKGLGAGLTLAVLPGGVLKALAAGTTGATVNHWLHVAADGTVTVFSNAQEMGQGAMSGVAQVLADEMRLPWQSVRVEQAPLDPVYAMAEGPSRWTGGSSSIRQQWDKLRKAGAAAREMLVQAGAARLGVDPSGCRAEDGRVVHTASGRSVAFADVAVAAASLPVPSDPPLTPRAEWRLIGKPLPRKDLAAKVDGSALYAADVRMPGMLSATIRQCPVFGGKLVSVDPAPAMAIKGVRHVVPLKGVSFSIGSPDAPRAYTLADAVIVVADTWWAAKKGLDALSPVWDTAGRDSLDTAGVEAMLTADLDREGELWVNGVADPAALKPAFEAGMKRAMRTVAADYGTPYLAHALMEPLSAAVHVRADGVEVWSGSQSPTAIQIILSGMTGVPQDRITAHTLYSGGGFGRRYINDYVAFTAYASRAASAPVKLIFSREEDLAQGRYRPATAMRLSAGLGADGYPTAIRLATADTRDDTRFPLTPPGGAQPDHAPPYFFAPALVTGTRRPDFPVPTGPWRAPGANATAFYFESFMDELAHAAGIDPWAYRQRMLADNPRALRVLDAAAKAAGWGGSLPKGRGRGIAIFNSFQSICAQVAEVSMAGDRLTVHKVTCVLDCGTAVNPDSIRAQGEGSVVMALSATAAEKVELKGGAVTSVNFDSYPLLHLARVPEIEVVILESPDAPVGGVGEPMVVPLPPALANAIFAASGRRVRRLPLSEAGITLA